MNEKKVVAVIVEGPSDENAIGSILNTAPFKYAFDF